MGLFNSILWVRVRVRLNRPTDFVNYCSSLLDERQFFLKVLYPGRRGGHRSSQGDVNPEETEITSPLACVLSCDVMSWRHFCSLMVRFILQGSSHRPCEAIS